MDLAFFSRSGRGTDGFITSHPPVVVDLQKSQSEQF